MIKKCPSSSGRKELDGDGVKEAGNSPERNDVIGGRIIGRFFRKCRRQCRL